ncbi:hypothetical protein [Undibacterium sp. Ren11W]|uniref:hypothetical protein n=1 Tax=Undibacterium sp. Ren11W TaxID=3413045 RepID=UPI003BF34766
MKTGERFWQLIGFVFGILSIYGLLEFSDAINAKQAQLGSLQQLLSRQEALLRDNHWTENLDSVEKVRKAWTSYLPVEKTPTFAKAHLLSDVRNFAKEAGITNLTVTATDAEGGEKTDDKTSSKAQPAVRFAGEKKKEEPLPKGVQMIKLTVTGRFDPVAFYKLLEKQEEAQRFSVIERLTVRGAQMELGIRCYWRLDPGHSADAGKPVLLPVKNGL